MTEVRISVLATETMVVPYAELTSTATLNDPTGTTPEFAFTALTVDPVAGDWGNGTWLTWASNTQPMSLAGVIVNTPYRASYALTASDLGVGEFMSWLRVGTVVQKVGKVEVFE